MKKCCITIFGSDFSGEGSVKVSEFFNQANSTFKLDILQDAIYDLQLMAVTIRNDQNHHAKRQQNKVQKNTQTNT